MTTSGVMNGPARAGVIAVVLGCAPADASDDDGADDDLPSPYLDDDGGSEGATPALGPEQVAVVATDGLRGFAALQPAQVIAAYEALAVVEDGCPEELDEYAEGGTTVQIWYSDGCTTSAGVSFAGGARLERYTLTEEGFESSGAVLNSEGASFSLATADGRSLHLDGAFSYDRGVGAGSSDATVQIFGHAIADAQTAAGSPLLDGSVSAQGYMYSYADPDVKVMGGEGAWSGAGLGDARAFSFAGFGVYSIGCAAEPSGTVSARDAEGFWHDIVFDGITVENEEPVFDTALCDGCGSYIAAGEPGGQACVAASELATLLDWETSPW
ncbi:MAG: hypothetical protein IAG13_28825 [Deltaproteobacteria bacterium]|nr:hypothetical protein [Nannocystaceae bacterium]